MTGTAKLQVAARGDNEIVMIREFDAPRMLVFDAFTKPELLKRWLGAFGGWSLEICEVDLKVGGAYRWVWRNTNGFEMGASGVYREIVPGEKIVTTERFDDAWYDGEGLGTVELVEQNGKTTMTQTLRYVSKEVRDAVLKSPMEGGVAMSYDKLAELLASEPVAST